MESLQMTWATMMYNEWRWSSRIFSYPRCLLIRKNLDNSTLKVKHYLCSSMGQINQNPRFKYWATRSSVWLAPLTHSIVPPCSLRLCAPLCSLFCSLAHPAHSLARGTVNDRMAIYSVFFSIPLFFPQFVSLVFLSLSINDCASYNSLWVHLCIFLSVCIT